MGYKKPFYTLKLKSKGCGYYLAVNGCYLTADTMGDPVNMEVPINQFLKNGENQFDFYHENIDRGDSVWDMRNDGEFSLELSVKEFGSEESTKLFTIEYSGKELPRLADGLVDLEVAVGRKDKLVSSSKSGEFCVKDGVVEWGGEGEFNVGDVELRQGYNEALRITRKVNLDFPFEKWRFFSADEMIPHQELNDEEWISLRKEMLTAYKPIWDAIDTNNYDTLKLLLESRCKEYDKAFYMDEGQSLVELVAHISSLNNDPKWNLYDLKFDMCDVTTSFNRKMVWLHDNLLPMTSSLTFKDPELKFRTNLLLFFSKFDGKWEIVR